MERVFVPNDLASMAGWTLSVAFAHEAGKHQRVVAVAAQGATTKL